MQLVHDDQRAAMEATIAMDHQVMMGPHATKNAAWLRGSLTGARTSRWPCTRSQAKQSKSIGTTVVVTAAACNWTAAAMPAQQDVQRQREEDVRAADATDGGVAMGGPCRNCSALP